MYRKSFSDRLDALENRVFVLESQNEPQHFTFLKPNGQKLIIPIHSWPNEQDAVYYYTRLLTSNGIEASVQNLKCLGVNLTHSIDEMDFNEEQETNLPKKNSVRCYIQQNTRNMDTDSQPILQYRRDNYNDVPTKNQRHQLMQQLNCQANYQPTQSNYQSPQQSNYQSNYQPTQSNYQSPPQSNYQPQQPLYTHQQRSDSPGSYSNEKPNTNSINEEMKDNTNEQSVEHYEQKSPTYYEDDVQPTNEKEKSKPNERQEEEMEAVLQHICNMHNGCEGRMKHICKRKKLQDNEFYLMISHAGSRQGEWIASICLKRIPTIRFNGPNELRRICSPAEQNIIKHYELLRFSGSN